MHREGQGATAPALLGGAEEPLLDGYLACDYFFVAIVVSFENQRRLSDQAHTFCQCSCFLFFSLRHLQHTRYSLPGTFTMCEKNDHFVFLSFFA